VVHGGGEVSIGLISCKIPGNSSAVAVTFRSGRVFIAFQRKAKLAGKASFRQPLMSVGGQIGGYVSGLAALGILGVTVFRQKCTSES